MSLQRDVVIGPGHSLNELLARLMHVAEINEVSHCEWELYPGPFGLYARHSDDWVALNGNRCTDIDVHSDYNNNVRCAKTATPINNFNKPHFYVNAIYEDLQPMVADIIAPIYCTYLDMENCPEARYHFAMMEFSTGAAEDLDYTKIPSLDEIKKRIRIKHEVELEYRDVLDINWVSVAKLLNKDYIDFHKVGEKPITLMDNVIDQYKNINRITDPIMQKIVDMPWSKIK